MGTALVLLGTIAAGMAGTAAMYRVAQNFQPGKQKIRKDYEAMLAELLPLSGDLVPIKKEELELLSSNQNQQKKKRGLTSGFRGVYTSIYQEAMIAWAMRKYLGSDKNALIVAKTAHHEFSLRMRSKRTDIVIDKKTALSYFPDGKFSDQKGRKIFGYISAEDNGQSQKAVYIGRREVATLQLIPETSTPNPRVFNFVAENLSGDERLLLLAMTIAYLTHHLN